MSIIPKDQIVEKIDFEDLLSTIRASMSGWPGIDTDGIEDVLGWARVQYGDFVRHVEIVDDPNELPTSVARAYMNWMNGWYSLNTQMNYQLMRGEVCDPRDQWRAMAISALASSIGDLLEERERDSLHGVVTTPR